MVASAAASGRLPATPTSRWTTLPRNWVPDTSGGRDVVTQRQREREDRPGHDGRERERQDDPPERGAGTAAQVARGLQHRARDALEARIDGQ